MTEEIDSFTLIDWVSFTGTFVGIISLIFTIYLTYSTYNIKEKVKLLSNMDLLKSEKQTLVNELKSSLDIINMDNGQYNPTKYNDLHRIIRKVEEYQYSMNKEDKRNFKKLKKMLGKRSNINSIELNDRVSRVIGFLDIKMDDSSNII